jgi:hypothetical protein
MGDPNRPATGIVPLGKGGADMRRRTRWLSLLAVAVTVAGCGTPTTPPTSGPVPPRAWHDTLLRNALDVHALSADVDITRAGPNAPAPLTAHVDAEGSRLREVVETADGRQITIVATGGTTYYYETGSVIYGEAPSGAPDDLGVSWLTARFPAFLRGIRFTAVTAGKKTLTATWRGILPDQEKATGTLLYNLQTHAPVALEAHIPTDASEMRMTVHDYRPRATLPPSTWSFQPPPGTVGVNASLPLLDALEAAVAQAPSPVLVPTAHAGLTITAVTVTKSPTFGPEIVLALTGPDDTPVLLTEYRGHARPPLPPGALVTTLAGRPVTEAGLNTGLFITFSLSGTTLVAEGNAANLTSLLQNFAAVAPSGVTIP